MLGRFVVPAARLDEFLESAEDFISHDAGRNWRLSVLAGEDIYDTIRQIEYFNTSNAPRVVCDTLELRASTESKIENTCNALPPNVKGYFEIPNDERLPDLISALAINGQRAKIRTGGITPDLSPLRAISIYPTCLAANVPVRHCRLHHPLRCYTLP